MTRIGIIGGGIAGLSAATLLSEYRSTEITVFEAGEQFGGRANVTVNGEHCPRLVLDDYHCFLRLLRGIPGRDGESLHSSLKYVQRLAYTESRGWVEISHLYSMFAREIPLREKLSLQRRRMSLLAAEEQLLTNVNTYASRRNYTMATLVRMLENLVSSRRAMALPGPTDRLLIDPWVHHLRDRGVNLHAAEAVRSILPQDGRVYVELDNRRQVFDAVIVATYIPDTIALLHASRIHNRLPNLIHTHRKAATIQLDPREPALRTIRPALYCLRGINILLQPAAARCVVLCTKSAGTDDHYIIDAVRSCLRLEHDIVSYLGRDNSAENESVFAADYVRLDRALPRWPLHVYFAGSYLKNPYPLDSAEGATRTAIEACRALVRDFAVRRREATSSGTSALTLHAFGMAGQRLAVYGQRQPNP